MNKMEYDILKQLNNSTKYLPSVKGFPKLYGGGEFQIKKPMVDQDEVSMDKFVIVKNSYIVMELLGKTL